MSRAPKQPPVVAELGRPETAQETADRKAASSAAYRGSQTFRGLIAALIATVGVVLLIVLIVPRGDFTGTNAVDLPAAARNAQSSLNRPVLLPTPPNNWRVNKAVLVDGKPIVWDITIAPQADDARGYAHIAQAFDADADWALTPLRGTASKNTVTIGGRAWDEYVISRPDESANINYALGTQVGKDYVLVYGALGKAGTAELVAKISPQIDELESGR
ncbi:DUF4245 family protein [Microbacterium sp.]|uniref:DUF4245 family protein n=1 Tax=Microbacterium sp. TaxID=51671 RepID=UPI001ACE684D|nr:DUF4245 family protein [Microbacterium sp.]MBN9157642.1 DUF4245 family protein [Microbacterium sp.]MBS1898484.1 DUF4245 family protein [Actinomycetota bacterium]